MSITDAQNGLDFHFKLKEEAFIIMAGTLFDTSEDHPESTGVYRSK